MKYVRSGESGVEKRSIRISELVADVDRSMIDSEKTLSVKLDGDAVVLCDRVLLNSAIGNLVGNASRFAKNEVLISSVLEDGVVSLHVDDDGPGVPKEYREIIFEPFSRLDNSKREHKNGVGLGLAIVQRAVENCGGEVSVSSSPVGGARFTVRLPVLKQEARG